jgi:hypothetical protein
VSCESRCPTPGPGRAAACGYARVAAQVDDGVLVTARGGDLACGCGCHAAVAQQGGEREVSRHPDEREGGRRV